MCVNRHATALHRAITQAEQCAEIIADRDHPSRWNAIRLARLGARSHESWQVREIYLRALADVGIHPVNWSAAYRAAVAVVRAMPAEVRP